MKGEVYCRPEADGRAIPETGARDTGSSGGSSSRLRIFAGTAIVLALVGAFAGPADGAKRTTTKPVTKLAKPVDVVVPSAKTIPLSKISIPLQKRSEYCKFANESKARLAELKSKKKQLASSVPKSVYLDEIALNKAIEKQSPKELAPEFLTLRNYTELFIQLTETQDGNEVARLTNLLSSEEVLTSSFDATVRIEAFVRRTCSFPLGI